MSQYANTERLRKTNGEVKLIGMATAMEVDEKHGWASIELICRGSGRTSQYASPLSLIMLLSDRQTGPRNLLSSDMMVTRNEWTALTREGT